MKRRRGIGMGLTLGLLATLFVGGSATASNAGLVGTWHQRDFGTSNIFYFVDEPVGGVYPVVFFDDATGDNVCGDNGPMMASGFVSDTGTDATTGVITYEGSLGSYWCPDNGDGVIAERPWDGVPSPWPLLDESIGTEALNYDPSSDTISGAIGLCDGFRQPSITTVAKAIHELEKGAYPAPDLDPPFGCD